MKLRMAWLIAAVSSLLVPASRGERVVLVDSTGPAFVKGYRVVDIGERPIWPGLAGFAAANGVHPGEFPALVDLESKLFVPVPDGDIAAAGVLLDTVNDENSRAAQDAKPEAQKLLENEWFAAVDELAAAAGEEAPDESDATDIGKVRAKLAKAKAAKDSASGQGKKAKADDLLEINELRGRLLLIDAELRTYDPRWTKRAKRHALD